LRRYCPELRAEIYNLIVYLCQLNQLPLAPWSPIATVKDKNQRATGKAGG
jgi:hypothetical protein